MIIRGWNVRQTEYGRFEEVKLPDRLKFALFHPLYHASEHFFDVGTDVFEFHPNA